MSCLLFCFSAVQGQKAKAFFNARLTSPISVKKGSFSRLTVDIIPAGVDVHKLSVSEGYMARDINLSKNILDKHMLTVRSTPSGGSPRDCSNHVLIANPSRDIELSDKIITKIYSIAVDKDFPQDVDSFNLVVTMVDNFDVVIPIKVEQIERVSKPLFKEDSVQAKCKAQFLAFLEQQHYPDSIFPTRKSDTSMTFISFCKMWKQQGLFDADNTFNPYAAYRFLTDDCGLKCNPKHNIKIYANFLRHEWMEWILYNKRVKGNKDTEVADWFNNME